MILQSHALETQPLVGAFAATQLLQVDLPLCSEAHPSVGFHAEALGDVVDSLAEGIAPVEELYDVLLLEMLLFLAADDLLELTIEDQNLTVPFAQSLNDATHGDVALLQHVGASGGRWIRLEAAEP